MRWIFALSFFFLINPQATSGEELTLHIGTHSIRATIANTPQSRARGLMKNTQLCKNCGMFFIFPRADKHSFWMKNTPLPLSIAFIGADGNILNIEEMQANNLRTHEAQGDALYALEMNKGWFTDRRIKAKDRLEGLTNAPKGQ